MALQFLNDGYFAGKVGIGTASPDYKLQVQGSVALDVMPTHQSEGIVRIGRYDSNTSRYNDIKSYVSSTAANNYLKLSVHGGVENATVDVMTLKGSGNVGIGVTGPGERLTIGDNGNVAMAITDSTHTQYIASIATANAYGNGSTVGQLYLRGYNGIGFSGNQGGATHMTLLTSGNVGIGTDSPLNKLFVSASTAGDYAGFIENTNSTNGYGLVARTAHTGTSAYAFSARAGASDIFVVRGDGNVGIGTTSPGVKLTVVTPDVVNTAVNVLKLGDDTNGLVFKSYFDATGIAWRLNKGLAGINMVTLSQGGNVGIGTTTPTNGKLVIDSTGFQASLETGTAGDGRLNIGHFSNGTFIGTYGDDGGVADLIRFGTHSGDERMRITSGGSVLVNTTSERYISSGRGVIEINGDTGAGKGSLLGLKVGNNHGGYILADSTQMQVYNHLATPLRFFTNANERMLIDSAGAIKFNAYGAGTLVTDASGNITAVGSGGAGPFLPLSAGSGEALTGALYGTSATFTGKVQGVSFSSTINTAQGGFDSTRDYLLAGTGDRGGGLIINDISGARNAIYAGGYDLTFAKETDDGAGTLGHDIWMRANATNSAGNVNTVEIFKNTDITGDLTVAGTVAAATYYKSSGTSAVLGTNASGEVLLRPTGWNLSTAQSSFTTTLATIGTNATFAGGITVSGNDAQFNHNIILEGSIYHKDDSNTLIGFPADDTIGLTTSGTERMRITSGGNVGIGTTTPQSKLQVAGGIQMADDTATASASKVGTMRYRTGTEYVEVNGVELVTNGDFATDTDWTKGANTTISGGTLNSTAIGVYIIASQNGIVAQNLYYKWTVTYTITSGGIRLGDSSSVWVGSQQTTSGTYTGFTQASSTANSILYMTSPSSDFIGSVDNVSVMEATAEDASYADMCMQTGASTYEWVNIVRNTY